MVRHGALNPAIAGSNPAAPANIGDIMKKLIAAFLPDSCLAHADEVVSPKKKDLDEYKDIADKPIDGSFLITTRDNAGMANHKLNKLINRFIKQDIDLDNDIIKLECSNVVPILMMDAESMKYISDTIDNIIFEFSADGVEVTTRRARKSVDRSGRLCSAGGRLANYDEKLGVCYAPLDDNPMTFIFKATKFTTNDEE